MSNRSVPPPARRIARRDALRHLAVFSAAAVAPGLLLACSKKPNCQDVTGLKPEEVQQRTQVAKYVDQTMDATKKCNGCVQYIAAGPDQCGGCKVVKGPIHPEGYCVLFAPKPA
jgi:hypothetical protein